MEEANICRWHLIVASVDQGEVDQVMDAARAAGATGGTILHARRAGVHEAEKFYGITLQKEKEPFKILSRACSAPSLCHISPKVCSFRLPIVQCIQAQGQTSPSLAKCACLKGLSQNFITGYSISIRALRIIQEYRAGWQLCLTISARYFTLVQDGSLTVSSTNRQKR